MTTLEQRLVSVGREAFKDGVLDMGKLRAGALILAREQGVSRDGDPCQRPLIPEATGPGKDSEIEARRDVERLLQGTKRHEYVEVLTCHLVTALASLQETRDGGTAEIDKRVARDCGLSDLQRKDGAECVTEDEDSDGEKCAACQRSAMLDRNCGLADFDRKHGAPCETSREDPCVACLAAKAGAATTGDDVAAIRARLDCGLSAEERAAQRCRLVRDDGPGDVCAECTIAAMGRSLDGAKDCERKAIEQRDAWATEAARLRTELAAARSTTDRPAKAPTSTQEPLSLFASLVPGSAPQEPASAALAPTAKPLRSCGCGGRGPHRVGCSLRKGKP